MHNALINTVIMAKATSVQNVYFLMVLFDFTKQPPGIALVSAIFKPTLCEDEKDVLALLSLRPKGDSSHWNLKSYINNIEDCYHRVGVPICFSVCKLATVYESKVTQLHLVQGPERCQAKHDDNP
ncbi:hypothetical protein OUZ56_003637 [Daphnia magna]|uniref:Uncharacterized protein n=1 Tax=Daphnia magna TaxID=35525 RepID=A0ABR0A9K0_9CRUS|nr:hypothetical protein OUZ56_003637 [Daphnia magna]